MGELFSRLGFFLWGGGGGVLEADKMTAYLKGTELHHLKRDSCECMPTPPPPPPPQILSKPGNCIKYILPSNNFKIIFWGACPKTVNRSKKVPHKDKNPLHKEKVAKMPPGTICK